MAIDLEKLKKAIPRKKHERPFCTAVIVAAGSSRRMGNDKIFAALGGLPVLVRSVRAFEENELVDEIIVVTREEKLEQVAELMKKYGLSKVSKVILGGKTRVESCLAGVSEADRRAALLRGDPGRGQLPAHGQRQNVRRARRDAGAGAHACGVPALRRGG